MNEKFSMWKSISKDSNLFLENVTMITWKKKVNPCYYSDLSNMLPWFSDYRQLKFSKIHQNCFNLIFSIFHLVCNIIWLHNSISDRENSIPKKYLKGYSLIFYTKLFSGIFYRSLIVFTPWGALGQIIH